MQNVEHNSCSVGMVLRNGSIRELFPCVFEDVYFSNAVMVFSFKTQATKDLRLLHKKGTVARLELRVGLRICAVKRGATMHVLLFIMYSRCWQRSVNAIDDSLFQPHSMIRLIDFVINNSDCCHRTL